MGYSSRDPPPSAEEPLGIPFPGLTCCERVDESTNAVTYEPNWVGSLAKAVNAQRTPSDALRVLDYAISGDTIARMKLWQVRREFIPQAGTTRPSWAPWTATDALFVTWIGINDCTWSIRLAPTSAQASFDDLFKAQTELYDAGARNFCLIDVPPVHIFPGGTISSLVLVNGRCSGDDSDLCRAESASRKGRIQSVEPAPRRKCYEVLRGTP